MSVRIFKLISGEMMIGKVVDLEQTLPNKLAEISESRLSKVESFTLANPFLLQYNANGFGLAPMFPWSPPTEGTTATFSGSHVMGEADMSQSIHEPFVKQYAQLTSPIVLANAIQAGNVRPLVR